MIEDRQASKFQLYAKIQLVHTRNFLAGSLLSFICLVAIAIQFISATYIVPMPEIDAVAFVPPAIEYRATGELTNPIYPLAYNTDPTGGSRFVLHAPLFVWLVGSIMPEANPQSAFLTIAS